MENPFNRFKLFKNEAKAEQVEVEEKVEELETRFLDIPENFETVLLEAGASESVGQRLLKDTRYKLPTSSKKYSGTINAEHLVSTYPKLIKTLKYLGISASIPWGVTEFFTSGYTKPEVEGITTRTREENNTYTLTAKGPIQISGSLKTREEYEAVFNNKETLLKILEDAGFVLKSYVEKKRTTLTFMGCKVEIDLLPKGLGMWAEIEGATQEQIDACSKAVLDLLKKQNYTKQPEAIGQTELIKRIIKEKKLEGVDPKNIKFET